LSGDDFTTARRGFALVLLGPFLVVVGIRQKTNGDIDRGEKTTSRRNRGAPRKQLPQRLS
jgi:hypothetical protein